MKLHNPSYINTRLKQTQTETKPIDSISRSMFSDAGYVFFLPSLQWDLNTSSFRPFSGQKISKTEPKITAVINCHFFRRDWVSEWMMCCYSLYYLCIPTNCWAFELLHSEKPEICQCHRSKTLRVIKFLNKRARALAAAWNCRNWTLLKTSKNDGFTLTSLGWVGTSVAQWL